MNVSNPSKKNTPSEKRSRKFHELFKSIPKNESLKYSSTCILSEASNYYQGRVYISSEHICFFSKGLFGRASIIIRLRDVLAIDITTKILLQQCLNIILYDKTYSFRAVSFKDDAYPIALEMWQKTLGLSAETKSVFQANIPRPAAAATSEKQMEENERVYEAPIQVIVKKIVDTDKAHTFYRTLTEEDILINTYMNRRTIRFANESIDEIYKIDSNSLSVDYHSKGTLCKINIVPAGKNSIRVRIVERYNYTTQHYFAYIESLISPPEKKTITVNNSLFVAQLLLALYTTLEYIYKWYKESH